MPKPEESDAESPAQAHVDEGVIGKVPRRKLLYSALRAFGSLAAVLLVYYLLPLDNTSTPIAVMMLLIGLAILVALVVFQVRWIGRSHFPGLRAIESLATSIPVFLVLFASTYVTLSHIAAHNFSERLQHSSGLYFAVTVFSTVGFGDITATTPAARLVVTGQMIADLLIIGVAIQAIVGAARQRRAATAG